MTKPLFEMRQVEVSYNGEPVVFEMNLKLDRGEVLGIVGESGSGKSTLAKAAMGLLGGEGSVTKGSIIFKGKALLDMPQESLRRLRGTHMGMIFQNCESALCPLRTIGDQLFEALHEHGKRNRQDVREEAVLMFKKMNMHDGNRILKSYPFELSGGMNQRVGIAMAMMFKPELLIADEPTSSLDVISQAKVVEEITSLREEYGISMVIITHNIGLVSKIADKIAVMHQGRLVEYGDASSVIDNPKEVYTQKLIQSVPRIRKG